MDTSNIWHTLVFLEAFSLSAGRAIDERRAASCEVYTAGNDMNKSEAIMCTGHSYARPSLTAAISEH